MLQSTTGTFVDVSSGLLTSGYRVRFRASGGSMRPAICDGDFITVDPAVPSTPGRGSVVVYRRLDRLFAHRVMRVVSHRAGVSVFVCRGDAAFDCDDPVSAEQILGVVVDVQRPPDWRLRRASTMLRRLLQAMVQPARRAGFVLSLPKGDTAWGWSASAKATASVAEAIRRHGFPRAL
jgi:Peptidase S24-like